MSEGILFLAYVIIGIIIGILFDFFRILRKSFKTSNFVTCLQDICFWLISSIIIIYSIFKLNNGELRGYIFLGILIGVVLYMLTISKYFIKINVLILDVLKKIAKITFNIIISPIRTILKILLNFLSKLKLFLIKIYTNIKNLKKFEKNRRILK